MSTLAASGIAGTASAAAGTALRALNGRAPAAALVFASSKVRLEEALAAVRAVAPSAATLGCSTAGEITERGPSRGSVAVLLIASDELMFDLQLADTASADVPRAVDALCSRYQVTARDARLRGWLDSTTV